MTTSKNWPYASTAQNASSALFAQALHASEVGLHNQAEFLFDQAARAELAEHGERLLAVRAVERMGYPSDDWINKPPSDQPGKHARRIWHEV